MATVAPRQLMRGLTRASLQKNKQLIPLLAAVGGGCLLAVSYLARLALKSPDVSWNKRANPEPWNRLGPKDQYKFYSEKIVYKDLEDPPKKPRF